MIGSRTTEPLARTSKIQKPDELSKLIFNLTSITNQPGLYYESHGETRLSYKIWDLVIFFDLKLITSKYDSIIAHYKATQRVCNQMTGKF